MRVLVTGGAGFAGTWLVRALLADGHTVVATRQEGHPSPPLGGDVEWIPLDVTSDESVEAAVGRAAPEQVYHLAGQASVAGSFSDPLGTWNVNATGTLRLAAALPAGARLLVVSSAEVYGVVPDNEQPIREDRPLRPCNPYAASKAAAEVAALQAPGPVVVARSFNHTGPGQDERFALASFARQLAQIREGGGEPLLRVGNLSARRDMLDVRDVSRAYVRLMNEGEAGQVYNVCSGHAVAMSDAVEQLIALSGTGARLEVDPARVRPVDVPLLCGSGARLRALGWAPEIAFRDTLAELLESHVQALRAGTVA
ncbi:MAG: GDP-mannose 4,6-dehydratase [uncultured Gemmatimonadetes bacterium]|uniref:GDP-mannose 4,6-dehydratase n=1 Tax=uncultured Gemmatimonadota bacterium TaxID=203437 RepID=A0A6J4KSR5_9BACT|nr:MAG: GDP-mannose 4,6-dehydratase [uncultured Gemmatimonadota bacterium]